jgi:type II restriction enzyme
MDSSQFEANLCRIDPKLPSLLGKCLLETTKHRKSSFDFVVPSAFAGEKMARDSNIAVIKKFLGFVARGLTPSIKWEGHPADFGGILYVVPEGDVLLFTVRNVNALEDYLFNNLKFEFGSRHRHGFGTPFAQDGRVFVKLNLQIRFR